MSNSSKLLVLGLFLTASGLANAVTDCLIKPVMTDEEIYAYSHVCPDTSKKPASSSDKTDADNGKAPDASDDSKHVKIEPKSKPAASDKAHVSPKPVMSQAQQDKLVLEAAKLIKEWDGKRDDLEKAFKIISKVLDANPNNVDAHIEAAYYYLSYGYKYGNLIDAKYITKAGLEVEAALKLDRKSAKAYILAATVNLNQGSTFGAVMYLGEAEKHGGMDIPDLYPIAIRTYLMLGRRDVAADLLGKFEKLLEKKPGASKGILNQLYNAQVKIYGSKDISKADLAYRKIISLDPKHAWSHGNYAAFLLYGRGDPDASIKEANAALKLMKYGMAEQVLACALYAKGVEVSKADIKKGQEYIDKARGLGLDWNMLMINSAASSGDSIVMQDVALRLMKTAPLNIDAQDEEGLTGLMKAAANGKVKSIEWIIKNGANTEVMDHLGHSAMYLASVGDYPDAVRMLGKLKANPDVTDKNGLTPLIMAVVYEFGDVVDALLEIGANPDFKGTAKETNSFTPLMMAAEMGNMGAVKSLLAAGADPGIQIPANSPLAGKTAASIADGKGHKDVAQLLLQAMQKHPKGVKQVNK